MLPAAENFKISIQHSCGLPVGALGHQSLGHQSVSSTQRNPSQFEAVKNSLRPIRRCGNCKETGHNRRRCQQPLPSPVETALVPYTDLGGEDKWKGFGYPSNVNEQYLDMVALAKSRLQYSKR